MTAFASPLVEVSACTICAASASFGANYVGIALRFLLELILLSIILSCAET